MPAHAAYQLLGDDLSCDEDTGSPEGFHNFDVSSASDVSLAQAEEQAAHGTHESTSHVHCLSAAVDCPSAETRVVPSKYPVTIILLERQRSKFTLSYFPVLL